MKKGRFLWSAHRITEKQKAGKARNIKEKQLKNSRNTVSKLLVEHHSSPNVNHTFQNIQFQKIFDSSGLRFWGVFVTMHTIKQYRKCFECGFLLNIMI